VYNGRKTVAVVVAVYRSMQTHTARVGLTATSVESYHNRRCCESVHIASKHNAKTTTTTTTAITPIHGLFSRTTWVSPVPERQNQPGFK